MARRGFDVLVAGALLLMLTPVLLLCAVAIVLGDGRPILFRQQRVGREGRRFTLLKFRTMQTADGARITAASDPRVTAVGRTLRRYKLDELPQLWNVLAGDMSVIGPRPEVPHYVTRAGRVYASVLSERPGMTHWASVAFWDEENLLEGHLDDPGFYERVLLPRKVALARLCRRERTWRGDVRLLAATACLPLGATRLALRLIGRERAARARSGIAPSAGDSTSFPTRSPERAPTAP